MKDYTDNNDSNDYDDDYADDEDDEDDDDDDDDDVVINGGLKHPVKVVDVIYGKVKAEPDEDDEYDENTQQMTGGADDSSDDDSLYNDKDDIETSNKIILPVGEDKLDYTSGDNDDDDDDDDEDDDENYLQKFNSDLNKNYVVDFHPECLINNFDEVLKFTVVVKDKNNNIIDPLHKTVPFLTKYERTRVIGQRAKQIEYGSKPFISIPDNVIDVNLIAELELQQQKIPFIIRRPIPGGSFEYWNLKDLEIIGF